MSAVHTPTPEQELVLALVRHRAGEDQDLTPLLARTDAIRLRELLGRTRMMVTFGQRLVANHASALPGWFADDVTRARDAARLNGLLQDGLLSQITHTLKARDVRVLPLKGTSLAETAYGDIGARSSADIDILVPREQLAEAVAAVTELGWREQPMSAPPFGLPRLHRVLLHHSRPPVELHWRVHWYEEDFSALALARAKPGAEGRLEALPDDQLGFLLLFLARDGFAGLRQVVDVVAWWDSCRSRGTDARSVEAVRAAHPALDSALTTAAVYTESLAGLSPGTLLERRRALRRSERLALELANPWFEGAAEQIRAEVSLTDGLLAPPGGVMAFARRRLLPPAHEAMLRRPDLEHAGGAQLLVARAAHTLRVLGRYVLATRRMAGAPHLGKE